MMHYRKGPNVEHEIKKEELPFEDCMPKEQDFLWMRAKGGTKVENVVSFAQNALDKGEYRTIVWTGVGGGIVKAVSSAEIMKRTNALYQVTRMAYAYTDEHWEPQLEGLDPLVVKRQIPCLHILLTLDKIDDSVRGVQPPGVVTDLVRRASGAALDAASSSSSSWNKRGNRGQQRQNQNQGRRGNGERRPQRQQQQQQKEPSDCQSQTVNQTTDSVENKDPKRRRNFTTPKPREHHNVDPNAPHTSSGHQKRNKNKQHKTKPEPMES